MSCECGQCRQHYRTLGIAYGVPTEPEIQEAYREAVKQWHPDLYQDYASLRADAEEHFKQIQIAFRELKEHNTVAAESVAESIAVKPKPDDDIAVQPLQVEPVVQQPRPADVPYLSFGNAPGCLVAPNFTPEAEELISRHKGKLGTALALVDPTGAPSHPHSYSQFLLLTELGMMVRDSRGIISLLWYRDLGEINLTDKQKPGKQGMWQNLMGGASGNQPRYELQIYRDNGTLFYSLSGKVDDRVKEGIHDFLQRKKIQSRS